MTNSITNNSSPAYEHSRDHLLEYFSKSGSIHNPNSYYLNNCDPLNLFKTAWYTGRSEECMKLLFWTRDCRGGAGARKNFRTILTWLSKENPEWIKANIDLIPKYGRWDDLKSLYNTPCEYSALKFWANALTCNDPKITPLASKWADRQDFRLRNFLKMTPKAFRKMVSKNSGDIVEKKMCANQWEDIDYNKVPSIALSRYSSCFDRHSKSFNKWKKKLISGDANFNISVSFPHDILRLAKKLDDTKESKEFIDSLFKKLPNFIEDPNVKIMPICDFSGSMTMPVSGSVTALDISLSLGLYCSDKIGENNPFYRKLIPFSSDAKLESWNGMHLLDAASRIPNGWCGSTNISSALTRLLEFAKFYNVDPANMVNTLIILSDMQFDPTCEYSLGSTVDYNKTSVENCIKRWEKAGYKKPKIIYWNLVGYNNQPGTKYSENIAIVSGFSPSILKATLSNNNITPEEVMYHAINKYNVKKPE